MTEFENKLHSMFDHIWECEIDHSVFQDTVGELMSAVIQCYNNLPSAQPEQRWITSGKPMNSGMYLVTLRQKFEGEETYRVRIMRFINGNWMLPKHFPEWINEEIKQEVLAWMPLPEPYRKEGEAND